MTFLTCCYILSRDIDALQQPSTSVVKSEPEVPGPSKKRMTVDSDEDDDTNYLSPESAQVKRLIIYLMSML